VSARSANIGRKARETNLFDIVILLSRENLGVPSSCGSCKPWTVGRRKSEREEEEAPPGDACGGQFRGVALTGKSRWLKETMPGG
jgi:hypothetical protein